MEYKNLVVSLSEYSPLPLRQPMRNVLGCLWPGSLSTAIEETFAYTIFTFHLYRPAKLINLHPINLKLSVSEILAVAWSSLTQ